ncbi:MAG TPA: ROK family protein [Solirubrobacterales bacterium]|nr:ROK family protein [Solirubrobacterales bacterium]
MATLRGGIDLGGTKIQTTIVDRKGEVEGEARVPTPTEGAPEDVARAMAAALRKAAAAAGVEPGELEGIGVGSPGDADERTGAVSAARNLPGWEGSFPLGEWLGRELGAPVRVGNDVQVATEAEFRLGAAKPYDSLLGVFWGTGVGGGLVLDRNPWIGRGAAGEIGHVVVERDGAPCTCGRLGCMEAYAGRAAMEIEARRRLEVGEETKIFELAKKKGHDRLKSGDWERALEHGDGLAERLLDRAVGALGTGIASACNILDPEAVVIGGGMGLRFADRYMEGLRAEILEHLFVSDRPPAIEVAELGDLGGAIGATLLFGR